MEDEYFITERVGRGSFGRVWDITLPGFVLKRVEVNRKVGVMSLLESYILKYINHKNIISANSIFVNKDSVDYIIPKAICDLSEISSKRFNTKYIYWQILCAIHELHSRNILHGDIKPSNILLF